jgi:hypothetical protein
MTFKHIADRDLEARPRNLRIEFALLAAIACIVLAIVWVL